jgi:hypothetical protein
VGRPDNELQKNNARCDIGAVESTAGHTNGCSSSYATKRIKWRRYTACTSCALSRPNTSLGRQASSRGAARVANPISPASWFGKRIGVFFHFAVPTVWLLIVVELFELGDFLSTSNPIAPFSIATAFDRVFAFHWQTGLVSEIAVHKGGT